AWLSASPADGKLAIAPRSPPTENTRRVPVTMTTRTALEETIDRVSASSAKSGGVSALTGGLSIRTTALPPPATLPLRLPPAAISLPGSAMGAPHALQQGARGLVAVAEARLQGRQPGLQQGRVERPDLPERALVRADDLAQDGVHLVALAQALGETPEILVDETQPDALGDVLARTGPRRDVRLCEEREQARIRSPAAIPVQEDPALALPSQVAFRTQRPEDSTDLAVLGDERRPLPVEDIERDVDAHEIERRERA